MTITYPLSLPSSPSFRSVRMIAENVSQRTEAPSTLAQTIYDRTGERWVFEVSYPTLTPAQAAEMRAFLLSLDGVVGTFLIGDPIAATPRGALGGTPLVNGNGQTGHTLLTKGWGAGITNVLRKGDYIQIQNRLYCVLTDTNSDGSGLATLDIWPNIRDPSPPNDTAITTSNCKALCRLQSSTVEWVSTYEQLYEVGFTAIEAI